MFLPNPRGSQGCGHAFAAAAAGAVGGAEWSDITASIDALVESGVADPDRLGIGGWSHGGFMAAWSAVFVADVDLLGGLPGDRPASDFVAGEDVVRVGVVDGVEAFDRGGRRLVHGWPSW
ncbi:alpha/beta hydrolase family protein [Streptacidiphilus anmyonensis]|uniref:alpha/beta hydrolase family protein n=1 Tax=Streptacidiphilus anmyonensis TaxID=405782 RepID=UPI001EEF57C3|nr:prolyl oligopeptidase family serine peptidase [Streptacidiphilus anmyonensis]